MRFSRRSTSSMTAVSCSRSGLAAGRRCRLSCVAARMLASGLRSPWATAAAILLVVWARPGDSPHLGGRRIAVKGGDVTIELVRERAGSVAWEPTSFTANDRFKLLLTCAPPLRVYADLVVLQSDGPAFPAAASLIGCGNRVPLGPGDASICVALDPDGPPSRAHLAGGERAVPGPHVCLHLGRP